MKGKEVKKMEYIVEPVTLEAELSNLITHEELDVPSIKTDCCHMAAE